MHYYQFNIGDYTSHTSHLDPLEDIAYRRMLDWVYLHESPLPLNVKQISKYIRMRDECERIDSVLSEFFYETDYGYAQKKAEKEIEKFRDKSEKAKKAIAARWAKKPNKPHTDVLQTKYERNTNHKPLTNNHKPITNKETTPKFNFKKEVLLLDVDPDTLNDWLIVRKDKKASNTKTAFNALINQITKSGLHPQQAIKMAASNSWAGFKADWVKNDSKTYSKVTEKNIENIGAWLNEATG